MKLKPDCIPCVLTMSIGALRKLALDEATVRDLYADILTISGLDGLDWNRTSPDIIEEVMREISAALSDSDPFHKMKMELNRRVAKIYPFLEKLVKDAPDPIKTAAKISILGNSIDFMMPGGTDGLEDFIVNRLQTPLSAEDFATFSQQLGKTKKILLFADNCGEILCDKLLMQTIKAQYDIDFAVVVRHIPTLNDATLPEAIDAGLDKVATVIDNGMDGPLPGTVIKRCSPEVRALIQHSDLIISKGGGNFDSLEEELPFFRANQLKITFMLLSKCHPIDTYFGTHRNHPILANFFN